MSGVIELYVDTGASWAVQLAWLDADNAPIAFSDPQMEMREDQNVNSTLIARFDESNNFDGTIAFTNPGTILITMSDSVTKNLPIGRGFWDLFVTINAARVKLAFGNVNIAPHVTDRALG